MLLKCGFDHTLRSKASEVTGSTALGMAGVEVGVGLDSSLVPGSPAMVSRLCKFIHQLCVLFVSVTRSITDHCHLSVLLQPLIGKLTDAIP